MSSQADTAPEQTQTGLHPVSSIAKPAEVLPQDSLINGSAAKDAAQKVAKPKQAKGQQAAGSSKKNAVDDLARNMSQMEVIMPLLASPDLYID